MKIRERELLNCYLIFGSLHSMQHFFCFIGFVICLLYYIELVILINKGISHFNCFINYNIYLGGWCLSLRFR
jgi:hypothetical protein